ncbi:MAG: 30S ribosomal protein S8 [Patescibacteria group bacterium]|nr:30S ribosomal protein S8 [Patescibacteria group bacterium]
MMTDPIADMLTRIRNAARAKHESVSIPFSKLKFKLAQLLAREKYVASAQEASEAGKPVIRIELKYGADGASAVTNLLRISKPGLRVYAKSDKLPVVLNGYGIAIISTPLGLMTGREAKKEGLGGEVVCTIH